MGVQPVGTKAPVPEKGSIKCDEESNLRQLQLELSQAKEALTRERERRESDRKDLCRLEAELALQRRAFSSVSGELETLSYAISHDLRAPLRHVIGFSEVLLEDFSHALDDTAQNYLNCIARGGRRMEQQIEALLGLSRLARQECRPSRVDLSAMARECAAKLAADDPSRPAEITIKEGMTVCADAVLVKAMLERLWENAWKFTGKKERAVIAFGSHEEGGATAYYLRDNGAGFDMRYADRLFGPFQRMHRDDEFTGVGVGLAAAQRIVHRHGGKIWADAEVDAGATFYFTLPKDPC